ncbi:MAG: hypothetical protein ACQES1_07765 [Bacteroidota bacterium]
MTKSVFLMMGSALHKTGGASIKNGYDMLTAQADKAWDIWERAYQEYRLVKSS